MTTDWITTFTGKSFYLLNPRPEDVCIEDIATALGSLCRFTGHTKEFYSIAQHSIYVSNKVKEEYRIYGLLHDATEAYIGDINKPLKKCLKEIDNIEHNIMKCIWDAFHLRHLSKDEYDNEIKPADNYMLKVEAKSLLEDSSWVKEDIKERVKPWTREISILKFITYFRDCERDYYVL